MAEQLATAEVGQSVLAAMEEQMNERDVCFFGFRLINVLAVNLKSKSGRVVESMDEKIARMCFSTGARVVVSKARRQHTTDSECVSGDPMGRLCDEASLNIFLPVK